MKYKVDVVRIRENSITLNGWALGKTPESKVTFRGSAKWFLPEEMM